MKTKIMGTFLLCFAMGPALAQTSLAPMRIIVPFAAGGGGDLIARILSPRLTEELKRTVVVENKVGAGGQLGMQYVKSAAADGSVVILASDQASVVVPLSSPNARYDTASDFVGLGRVAQFPYALAVSRSLNVETAAGFIEYLKNNPKKADFGLPSLGGIPDMAAHAVGKKAGVSVVTVPYSGAAPIMAPLIGGQLTSAVIGFNNVFPAHLDGKLRVLAVTGANRSKLGPAIPTFQELGIPGLKLVSNWTFYAPRGLPPAEAARFNAALNKILAQPEVTQRIEAMFMEVAPTTLDETRKELDDALLAWKSILRDQGLLAKP
jgi:tripartite-type tricarboxylate transporter receptor subunit TctC